MNWYTKRISLAAVYKSSELYMITSVNSNLNIDNADKDEISAAMAETRHFIDRRINDVMSFGKLTSKVNLSIFNI